MGRSLAGNSVSQAVTTLSRRLGNISSTNRDSATTSGLELTSIGGYFAYNPSQLTPFYRNSVSEQTITVNHAGVLQDDLSDYTYFQSRGYYNANYNGVIGVVYDADLNAVYTWGNGTGATPPFSGNLFCIRLYNSALYFFSLNGGTMNVTKVALPSGTVTTYSYALTQTSWQNTNCRVFNWPINGKYYIYITQGSSSPYHSRVITFDITGNSFAQFGVTDVATGSTYITTTYGMHVKSDESAVSVAYVMPPTGDYGVIMFDTTQSVKSNYTTSGHWFYNGSYPVFCNNNPWNCAVTTDCIVDQTVVNNSSGDPYRTGVGHLQGGDTSVRVANLAGVTGANQYPFSTPYPTTTQTVRDQLMGTLFTTPGTLQVTRTGTTLSFTRRNNLAINGYNNWGAIPSKLPDNNLAVEFNISNVNSASGMWLNQVFIRTLATSYQYTYSQLVSGQNQYGSSYLSAPQYLSFITSTGRFFSTSQFNSQSSQSGVSVIKGSLPVFIPSTTKTYNVTVIGGGGGSTGSDGELSQFGTLSANAGTNRVGFVAGSTVLTSGPTRGTGGTGYGTDAWGQGEDTASAGTYGGGSGYVTTSTLTLSNGTVLPYRAGFGPLYGKQGAVLLSEV